ncbi:MAG: hypothetical protein J6S85_02170 [Methanobrevibacter sp.]|nr:hypothetical protein [Methanobrevibacter sp.]MBO7712343.1 hypothetical protein [Methanobrevibacter sp.]
MSKYVLDTEKLAEGNWEHSRIKAYAEQCFNGDEFVALLYLWLYNNFSTSTSEVRYDNGRPMYRKLATILKRLFEVKDD